MVADGDRKSHKFQGRTRASRQARGLQRHPSRGMMLALALSLGGCAVHPDVEMEMKAHAEHDVPAQGHWSYMGIEGPGHWAMLTPAYRACEAGHRQSPINIDMTQPVQHHARIEFRYATSRVFEVNNGHTIQVSHTSGCAIGLGDEAYLLRQFHFHVPSEHHIHGTAFPMEMHLVHQDAEGRVVVVAVLMKTGSKTPVLNALWEWLPEQIGKTVSVPLDLNISRLLPTDPQYFSYSGSLTTPPCTEGVRWIILQEPVEIAEEDVRRFVDIIGYNARPVQPREGREVHEN